MPTSSAPSEIAYAAANRAAARRQPNLPAAWHTAASAPRVTYVGPEYAHAKRSIRWFVGVCSQAGGAPARKVQSAHVENSTSAAWAASSGIAARVAVARARVGAAGVVWGVVSAVVSGVVA